MRLKDNSLPFLIVGLFSGGAGGPSSTAPPPCHPFFVFGRLGKRQSDGGFLPGSLQPPRNSPTVANLSDKKSEQFPERDQHISDVEQRPHFSCAPHTHTVTSHLGHTPMSTVTWNAPRRSEARAR